MQSILFVGNSFVRMMSRRNINFDVDPEETRVGFCGYGQEGQLELMEHLQTNMSWLLTQHGVPDIVVLIIGASDVAFYPQKSPRQLAQELFDISVQFIQFGVQRVIVPEVLPRFGPPCYGRRKQFIWKFTIALNFQAEWMLLMRMKDFNSHFVEKTTTYTSICPVRVADLFPPQRGGLLQGLRLTSLARARVCQVIREAMVLDFHRKKGRRFRPRY